MKGIHYQLLEPIHELFQGRVFKAEWSGVEGFVKFVSVCKVRPELCGDSRAVDLLLEDLKKISRKPVGAVTRVLDAWTGSEGVAACTEYEAGVTLWELLEKASGARGTLLVESLLSIVLDVARALETLHEPHVRVGEIFHGDLRPEHILLSHSGAVKLQGLGYGRFLTAANPAGDWFLWRGRCYQPRERQRGGPADPRGDVFSLGGVLYEALTGHPLFSVSTGDPAAFVKAAHSPAPFQRGARRKEKRALAGDLRALIETACHPDPRHRYASISEMAEALHRGLWERKHPDSSPSLNLKLLKPSPSASEDGGEGGEKYHGETETAVINEGRRRRLFTTGDVTDDPSVREGKRLQSRQGMKRSTGAFVGRRLVSERAENALNQVVQGGKGLLITGKLGMGRSRALREVKKRFQGAGASSAWIGLRLRSEERHVAYSAVLRLLGAFMGLDSMADLSQVGQDIQRLRAFALDEKTIDTVCGVSGVADLDEDPARVSEMLSAAVMQCLSRLCWEQTTVVACDDVQFVDDASIHTMERLLDGLDSIPALLLMTATHTPPFIEEAASDLVDTVKLPPLTERECELFLIDRVDGARSIDRELLAMLVSGSKGSPLMLREFTDFLMETGGVELERGRISRPKGQERYLPPLADLARKVMGKLPKEVSSVVLMGALAGPALSPKILSLLGGLEESRVEELLQELEESRRFIKKEGDRYVFRNENLREIIVEAARPGWAKKLTKKLAEIVFLEWDDPPWGTVDHLASLLERWGETDRAAEVLLESAERQKSRGDYGGAAQKYGRAAEITGFFEGMDDKEQVQRLLEAGEAGLSNLNIEFSERVVKRAIDLSRRLAWERQRAESSLLLAKVYTRSGRVNEAIDLAREAAPVAEKTGDDLLMAKVYASIAESYQQWGKYGPDAEFVSRAVRIAGDYGDVVKLGEYLQLAVMHAMGVGDYEKTWDYLERARPIAEASQDPLLKARLSRYEGLLCLMIGSYERGIRVNLGGVRFARRFGLVEPEIVMLHNAGDCHYNLGNIREALYHFNESLRRAERTGFQKLIASNNIFIGHIEATHLKIESGFDKLRQAIKAEYRVGRLWNIPHGLQLRGRTELALGRPKAAAKSFRKAVEVANETGVQYFIESAEQSLREFQVKVPAL